MYNLIRYDAWVSVREADGSGYLVRAADLGKVAATWICSTGQAVNEVVVSPERFLSNHPDIAGVPGVGAALRQLAYPPDAAGSTPGWR